MASKRQKQSMKNQDRRKAILSVVRAYLNMDTLEEYQDWCIQQGFSQNLNKSQTEICREYGKYKQRQAFMALRKLNRRKDFKNIIVKLHAKEMDYADLKSEKLVAIYDGFYETKMPDLLRDTFLILCERSAVLDNVDYIKSVVAMVEYAKHWIRPVIDWRPKSKNVHRQFRSLVRFLFAHYEIPVFMDAAWRYDDTTAIGWYLHLGRGGNIRTAKAVPVKLTRKMAHLYLQAPDNYTPWTAFRWAQVRALGGNGAIADAVAETRLGREFVDDKFWMTVIQFFVNNPMLDRLHYGPIVDYIFNQKYENRPDGVRLQEDCDIGGEQPGFSMKGRTPASLLRHVDEWHRQLGKISNIGKLKWEPSKFAGLHHVEKGEMVKDRAIWTIRELLSSKELFVEGHVQNHCVATYDNSCTSGESSIWTMEVFKDMNTFKLLTIEVDNAKRMIVQVRGRHNRMPYEHEVTMLKRWASKARLSIDQYVTDAE